MSLDPLLRWLEQHINLESKPSAGRTEGLSLDPIRGVLRMLGNPHEDVPAIHVTGTNGKGSTSHLTARILAAHGLSVGGYGSPHVESLNERIQLAGAPVDDDILADGLSDVKLAAEHVDNTPSWFELMTATAFRIFNDQAVEAAVIEVGMLGRYDATNVAATRVAVVTNIAQDHTDGAEGWREAIAGEKAGIVKPGSTLLLGDVDEELHHFFLEENPGKVLIGGRDFSLLENDLAVGGRNISVRTSRGQYEDVFLGLNGTHQARNALLAIVAAEEFLDATLEDELLAAAFTEPFMPARFEVVHREPLIILDGSHNPAGAATAARTLNTDFQVLGQRYLVVGWMEGRDPAEMLQAFDARNAELVLVTEPRWPRVMAATKIAEAAASLGVPHEIVSSPFDALDRARALATENDVILVAGSFYLAGPLRAALREEAGRDLED